MKQFMHAGSSSQHRLIDTNLRQVEGGQGIEETVLLMDERKSAINSIKHEANAVMK